MPEAASFVPTVVLATAVAVAASVPVVSADDGRTGQAPPARRDSLVNGVLIGAGIGFAGGFLGMAAVNAAKTASGPLWDGEAIAIYSSAGLLGAAAGAGLGALVDGMRPNRSPGPAVRRFDVIPVVGPRRRGMLVTIRR
jgi:hypothetical protein